MGWKSGGLYKYNKETDSFKNFSEKDGLIARFVSGILEEKPGVLWISTAKGLSRFNYDKMIFDNYYVGSFNRADASIKLKSGEMLFGKPNGLFFLYPKKIKKNKVIPPVILTSFKILNKEIQTDVPLPELKEYDLTYKDQFFSFDFSALDFSDSKLNQFKYKLEGFDGNWISLEPGRHFAGYTNIPGGEYVFRVKGSNNDGVWNEDGISLKLNVAPPFWKTNWFYGLISLVVFLIICLVAFYIYRLLKEISERKQAEKKLKQREKDLKKAQQMAQLGNWEWNVPENRFLPSDEMRHIYGIDDKKEFSDVQDIIDEVVHPDDREYILAQKEILLETGKGDDLIYRIILPGGEIRWVEAISPEVNSLDQNGHPITIFGTIQDITDRKESETKLRESEEKHKTIFKSSQDAIFLLDPDAGIIDANPAAMKMFKIPSKEELEKLNPVVLSPEIQPDGGKSSTLAKEKMKEALENGSNYYEWVHKRLDGATFPATVLSTRLVLGGKTMLQRTIRDITQQKEDQKKLNHRSKMDAIGQLAGGVAHDFNNMLGGIMGAAQLLSSHKSDLDEKGEKYIDMIMQASERAASLTSKLLAFGRQGKHVSTAIDIHQILDDTIGILGRTVDKKIRISLNEGAEHCMVIGDDSELQNAFMNIGINASHAMPDGGDIKFGTRNIRLKESYCESSTFDLKPGHYIQIEINDTGCGIPLENLQKIFEPFYTTKEQGKGTGLGLSAVYGTVQDHHGVVNVYSEIGVGTKFHILLPCSEQITQEEKPAVEILSGSGLILLVDDENIIRVTAKNILEGMGYKILLAENGQEAVDLFTEHHNKIDLVLMDMVMPKMNGEEAFLKMKDIDKNCKVVISSGFSKNESIEKMRKAGLAGFIRKPYKDYELSQILSNILSIGNHTLSGNA